MKLTFVTSLFLTVMAVAAAGQGDQKLAKDKPCQPDGSLGTCKSGKCNKDPAKEDVGKCA